MAMVCLICSRHYKTVTEFYSHLHKEHPKHFSKNQDHLKQSVKDRDYLKQLIKDQEQSNNFVKNQEHLKYFEQAQENPKHFTKYEEDFKCSIKDQDYAKYFINDAKNIKNKDVINKKMCVKCGIQFQSNQSWFNHNKYCGKEPHLSCEYCPHKTKYKWNLKQHNELKHSTIISSKLKLQSGSLESVSEKESKGDDSPFITTPNKLSILNMTKYYCHKCDQTINDIQKFDKICKKCGKELTLQCIKCNRFYKKYQSMIYHLQSKCDPQTYFHCSKCDYTTSVSNLIKKHVLRVHGINYKTNTKKCVKCGKRCRSLFEHTRCCEKESNNVIRNLSDIRTDRKSFIKNLGSRVSPRKNEIINTVHSSNNTKECLKCGKTYENINHHIEFCQRDKIFSCELCTFKTKYKYNLKYHMQTHKSKTEAAKIKAQDGLEQVLKQTKKVIKQNNAIKLKMHNVMESYCPKCNNKNIANKYVTKCRKCRTRLTFRCVQCNVKYRKLASLQLHTKNHNSENSRNIECTNCNKTFAIKKNFQMHRNICMKELSLFYTLKASEKLGY
ncbi:PREDICTED: zinc finger protein 569-like [Ceratosolen solmsi marchali]|uniref:Zinc finger protein 569-like n=1 Tax=Ceratosolen solmsi marchali TaxID=326594 RepID=A0AAJ6YWN3_9HYME|nr:PREDICTED: zinc finger protein 569-like [Ceratosolen solmsi marchali]